MGASQPWENETRAMRLHHARALCLLAMLASSCARSDGDRIGAPSPTHIPPLGVIELPPDSAITGNDVKLTGWAGDDVGVRLVRVLVDGNVVALAAFTVDRPDVTKVYPQLRHGTDRYGYEATV